jgi:asparagine synthase (glutamine-hydrolysing)
LAQRARQDVTVVLSGEGADEVFGGYPTYVGHRLAGHALARGAASVARLLPGGAPARNMPATWFVRRFLDGVDLPPAERHVAWFAGALPADALITRCPVPAAPGSDPAIWAMRQDFTVWLPNRLLAKLDRATMRVGLEARAPFLDPAVVQLANTTPAAHVGPLRGKRLLRRAARPRVPSYILRRTKRGMSVPVGALLNGPLRAEADRLLAPDRLARAELVNARRVTALLDEHRRGAADHGRALWTLFTFEAWRERNDP